MEILAGFEDSLYLVNEDGVKHWGSEKRKGD